MREREKIKITCNNVFMRERERKIERGEKTKKMKMSKCFSFTASRDWLYRQTFANAGLRPSKIDVGRGFGDRSTIMHCWIPKSHNQSKPTLLLIHGFGANAMWQYADLLRHFVPSFNVYVPDLLFFGQSFTLNSDRSESYQAQCLMDFMNGFMEIHKVEKISLVGISYGGFVGYSMAAQFPKLIERCVLCCAGVCLEEKDLINGLFVVSDIDEAASILLPQTPDKLRKLMKFSFVKPTTGIPSWFLTDFINVMNKDHAKEKRELIESLLEARKLSSLPKITQPTLVLWGEEDQIFPLELGHRLKRHIGESAELRIIKNAGHAVNLEKPREFAEHLKSFLLVDSLSSSSSPQN